MYSVPAAGLLVVPASSRHHRLNRGVGERRLDGMSPLPPIEEKSPRFNKGASLRNGGRIFNSYLSTSLPEVVPSITPRGSKAANFGLEAGSFQLSQQRRFEKFNYSMKMYSEMAPPPRTGTHPLAPVKRRDILANQKLKARAGNSLMGDSALFIHNTTDRSVAYFQHEGSVIVDSETCFFLLGKEDCNCRRCNVKQDMLKRHSKKRKNAQRGTERKDLL